MARVESIESSQVRSYRDLIAWQKSMDLMQAVYVLVKQFPADERYALTQQIRRCAVSVPSNIAEGSSRRSTQEFIRFLNIASGSLAELETQLTAARMFGYVGQEDEMKMLSQCDEVSKIIGGLCRSLEKTKL